MAEPFIAEVRIFSFNFPPKGWALCNGQLMPINQNQPLFALLGTTYGGDGRVNFALPNLQGRIPIHVGAGFVQGQGGGEQAHTLSTAELTQHTHTVTADTTLAGPNGNQPTPTSRLAGSSGGNLYGPANNLQAMDPGSLTLTGGSQAHDNMAPYLTLNLSIALQGIFPSQN